MCNITYQLKQKTTKMKASQIKKATKGMTLENATAFIQNLGFELELLQEFSYGKMWKVKNNTEILIISNFLKNLSSNECEIKFSFN
jgi:hypothetical protein